MDSPLLAARAPFDLIIANILAGPLIELAPDFARALTPGGTVMLAGLLDTQADAVVAAYEKLGFVLATAARVEWPVLISQRRCEGLHSPIRRALIRLTDSRKKRPWRSVTVV